MTYIDLLFLSGALVLVCCGLVLVLPTQTRAYLVAIHGLWIGIVLSLMVLLGGAWWTARTGILEKVCERLI